MRDLAGREAEEAEDDVLDPLLQVVHPVRDGLARLLAEQPEDHREVVDAERPERVLVRADHAEVLAVAVDAGDLAERAGVDELLHLAEAGVVEEQVARHQHEVALLGERDELLHLLAAHRRRLLDEDVLAGLERLLRELVVRRDGRCDDDRVDGVVGQQLVERGGRRAPAGSARRTRRAAPRRCRRSTRARRARRRRARRSSPSRRRPRGRRGSKLPDLLARDARAARGVAQVDDELGVRRRAARSRSPECAVAITTDVVVAGLERHRARGRSRRSRTTARGGRGRRRARRRSGAARSASRRATRASRRCPTCRRRRARAPREPASDFCAPWLSACETRERQ